MGVPAAVVTVTLQDADGQQTKRSYEARSAAITDAQAIALADDLQAITQLAVVGLSVTRNVAGFTPIAVEQNASVAETASVRAQLSEGDFYSFNLPALKSAVKAGKNVNGGNADLQAFLAHFDNGDGAGASQGNFFVSDGETLSETYIEDGNVSGQVNR